MTRSVIDKIPFCTGGYACASVTPSAVSLADKDVKAGSRGIGTGQAIIKTVGGHKGLKMKVEAVAEMIVNLQVVGQTAVAVKFVAVGHSGARRRGSTRNVHTGSTIRCALEQLAASSHVARATEPCQKGSRNY